MSAARNKLINFTPQNDGHTCILRASFPRENVCSILACKDELMKNRTKLQQHMHFHEVLVEIKQALICLES